MRLPWFDPTTMNPTAFVAAYGSRGSGKSRMFLHWLFRRRHQVRYMVVFSTTNSVNGFWSRHLPPIFCAPDLLPHVVARTIERNKMVVINRPPGMEDWREEDLAVVMMFDDVMQNGKALRNEVMKDLATNGRHAKTNAYFCVQKPSLFPTDLRNQCQLVVVFREKNQKTLKVIWEENFGTVVPDFKQFVALVKQVTSVQGRALVLDTEANKLYIYKAELKDLETLEWNPYLDPPGYDIWHISPHVMWPYYYRYMLDEEVTRFNWNSGKPPTAMLGHKAQNEAAPSSRRGGGKRAESSGAANKAKRKGTEQRIVVVREDGTEADLRHV